MLIYFTFYPVLCLFIVFIFTQSLPDTALFNNKSVPDCEEPRRRRSGGFPQTTDNSGLLFQSASICKPKLIVIAIC